MANSTANLSLTTSLGHRFRYSSTTNYNEVFQVRQEVDNTDAFIDMLNVGTSIAAQTLRDAKMIVISNPGDTVLEIQTTIQSYKNNSNLDVANAIDLGGGSTNLRYINFLLPAGEFLYLPNNRVVSYEAEAGVSACNATSITDVLPSAINSAKEYVDSTVNLGEAVDGTETEIDVSDGDFFKVGDLIQLGTNATDDHADEYEFMRVTGISTNTLTVERALFGSEAGTSGTQSTGHVSSANVYLPHFNEYHDYDKFTTAQTDSIGRFKCSNFFGYGRTADTFSDGIVPGSVAIQFYSQPVAKVGLNNISSATESGLTAGTSYEFAINPGSTEDISFTVDSSNTKFGGNTGIVRKIQAALDAKYYTPASNLFEKKITVAIIGGDLVFRLHESLSTSSLSIGQAADLSGTTNLFADSASTGRFPAKTAIPTASSPSLPTGTKITGGFTPQTRKTSTYITDDGHGRLSGSGGSGSINYATGACDFVGRPNSHFTITATYNSAMGGTGDGTTSGGINIIKQISARSTSSKEDGVCSVIAFN